jgi:acetyl/propionyl-CoA carboxylase alpha subunit
MPQRHPTWKVKCNEFIFLIDEAQLSDKSVVQISATEFNCIKDSRSVNALVLEEDSSNKKIRVEVEGEVYEVEIKNELDQMLDEMGFSTATAKIIKEIKAPMPGLVLEVAVTEGQEVKEAGKLLILGAMKMENIITLQASAKIKRIAVKAGEAVEKGQVLVELE